jgi:hypothetical protein
VQWLERNRPRLDNKYHASKFYLLAVVLPWLCRQPGYERHEQHDRAARRATDADAA